MIKRCSRFLVALLLVFSGSTAAHWPDESVDEAAFDSMLSMVEEFVTDNQDDLRETIKQHHGDEDTASMAEAILIHWRSDSGDVGEEGDQSFADVTEHLRYLFSVFDGQRILEDDEQFANLVERIDNEDPLTQSTLIEMQSVDLANEVAPFIEEYQSRLQSIVNALRPE